MTIGIWGSCVTRDVFEVVDVPGVDLSYHARSSWVAQAAPITSEHPVKVPDGDGFGHRTVREDLQKEILGHLVEAQPDLVIIDLIDERFDVVEASGSRYTMSDYYGRLGLEEPIRAAGETVSAFRDEGRQALFGDAVARLAPLWMSALPTTKFVLHQAWYTARAANPEYVWYGSAATHVTWSNERLARHYGTLIDAFGDRLHVIEADRSLLIADPSHRWGLAHFHYVPAYYHQIADGIAEIRAGQLRTRRATAPEPPTSSECGSEVPDVGTTVPTSGPLPPGAARAFTTRVWRRVRRHTTRQP